MKRDLYRFAKARKNKRKELFKLSADEIKMIEYNYYYKFNNNYAINTNRYIILNHNIHNTKIK